MQDIEIKKIITQKIGSPKIFVYLVIWLMFLVFFGTIAQRDSGLYYHTEEYIQACLNPYIKEILFKYKHRVRDDTFVLRDRLYSQYYVLLV